MTFELHDSKAHSQIPNMIINTKTADQKMNLVEKINTEIKQIEGFTGLLGNPTLKCNGIKKYEKIFFLKRIEKEIKT